jgi:hypothetical protein
MHTPSGQCCVHLYARILSTSFTSVSIFSVCWYSSVSYLNGPPSPPIQVYCTQPPLRHTEHMTSKREYSKGRSQIFLAVILFGSCPPRHHSWYSHNGSPFHSLLLIELVHVCLYLPARGTGVEQIIWQQNKCGFLPFYCSMHTCNLTHSVFLIWY